MYIYYRKYLIRIHKKRNELYRLDKMQTTGASVEERTTSMKPGHAILPASTECREERERKEKRNHIKTTETRTELKCFSIKCCQMYDK